MPDQITDQTQGANFERWDGIPGVTVGSLMRSAHFREAPDLSGLVTSLELPKVEVAQYGARIRGYIVAPKTGKVRFVVSSDDNSELWLSPGRDATAIKRIAWIAGEGELGSSAPFETGKVPSQTSEPVTVQAGDWYYFEAFHKQGDGDNHFELLWQFETDTVANSIPADSLRPWNGSVLDANDDGLADGVQSQSNLAGIEQGDAWGDPDGDGVMNIDELAAGTDPVDGNAEDGFLLWESWYGLKGRGLGNLAKSPRFNGPADRTVFLRGSSTPSASTGNVGTRLSGYIVPKESGDYELGITSDDTAELWFAESGSWLDKKLVAFNDRWGEKDSWYILPSQHSKVMSLEAGHAYYVEVLHKDARAPGWVTLGWKKTGDNTFSEITPEFLRSPGKRGDDLNRDFLPDSWAATEQARMNSTEGDAAAALTEKDDPDGDGLSNLAEAQLGTDPLQPSSVVGSLTREWWFNVPGQSVVLARNEGTFLQPASMTTLTPGSGSEVDTTDWFASRLRGTFVAPVSGSYRFWIAGDDHCELWISSEATKFYKKKVALVGPPVWEKANADAWTKPKDWDLMASQKSGLIDLQSGQSYFIEMLHKAGGGNDHVSVAWQFRENGADQWSDRVEIPAPAVTSFGGEADDADDDYLPDSWEEQYGLDADDNGLADPARQGEAGDYDGDGLTNRDEFLLGTNPCLADTDGDGVGDFDEVKVYGSNPARKDASPPVKQADLPLDGYAATPGGWLLTESGTLLSIGSRSAVDFPFELSAAGVYLVEFKAAAVSSTGYVPPVPVIARVDGTEVGSGEVVEAGSVYRWLTPWLPAGSHTVMIDNRNMRLGLALEITSVALFRHEGQDLDGNSIPDWMENLFKSRNAVDPAFTESAISPICVEGSERYPGGTRISKAGSPIEVKPGLAGRWYANVPLDPAGDTAVSAIFENGSLTTEANLVWTVTNLFESGDVIRVRKGDSLRVTAVPPGTDGHSTTALLTLAGESLGEGQAAEPRIVTFDEAGSFVLAGHTVSGIETLDTSITVQVVTADFGNQFNLAAGTSRVWKLSGVPRGVAVESDPALALEEVPRGPEQSRRFTVSFPEGPPATPRVLARLWDGGPVISDTTVNVFRIVDAAMSRDARVVNVLPDGTQVVEFSVRIDGKIPSDLSIWIDFLIADAVFANGDTRYHLTAADFDENGVARILVYRAPAEGAAKICHLIRPYFGEDPDASDPE